jgi:phosphoribosylaminoimidazole-succinocarboxamide synthase
MVSVLNDLDLPLTGRREGKVRISWDLFDDRRVFVVTDRLSAFDRVLGCVPGKGQMLNELSWWWFSALKDVVPHHALALPDPNVLIARSAKPLSVEVIVRGAITGVTSTSLWQRYNQGQRHIDGHHLPDGLRKNQLLPTPIITPTTKADAGFHDEPLSVSDVTDRGLVAPSMWRDVCDAALAIFATGTRVAADAGLILADTKYEFGLDSNGAIMLIDEVHTPDSSRYWEASTYEARTEAGEEPVSMDKEIIRRAYAELGYRGDGPTPELDQTVWDAVEAGYSDAFRRLTGSPLQSVTDPTQERIVRALTNDGYLQDQPMTSVAEGSR